MARLIEFFHYQKFESCYMLELRFPNSNSTFRSCVCVPRIHERIFQIFCYSFTLNETSEMRQDGFSDDDSLDGFGDYDDEFDIGYEEISDAESGFEEPTTSSVSVSVSESLQDAMNKCILDRVDELVQQIENYETFKLQNNLKPLQFAAQLGYPELVQYFLDIDTEHSIDNRELIPAPLMLACSTLHEKLGENHLKCVELLLDAGVDVNIQNEYGVNSLMSACKCCALDTVQLLISRGARVNDCDNDGWSPLFYAANRGEKEIVQELLKHEVDLEIKDKRDRYAYNIACDKGLSEVAELIKPKAVARAEEASLNMVTVKNVTTLDELMKDGDPEYFDDVYEMLSGVASDMERYVPIFRDKKITLGQFLLLKREDDLKNIGVPFSWHRQTIIARLRQFHLGCWYPSSLGLCEPDKESVQQAPSHMMKLLTFVATLRQQMFVLKKSFEYLQDDVITFIRDDPEMVKTLKSMQTRLQSIHSRLQSLGKRIHMVKVEYEPRLLAQQV